MKGVFTGRDEQTFSAETEGDEEDSRDDEM